MSERERIWVHPILKQELNLLRQKLIVELKKKYNIKEVTVSDTFLTQVFAAKFTGSKAVEFKVHKTSLTTGRIEIVGQI